MLFDTNFLIHYTGQRGKKSQEAAQRFADAHLDSPLYTSRVAWVEFAEGCATKDMIETYLAPFTVIEVSEQVAWEASRISRALDRRGLPIGDNDVWIAATAKVYRLPLVSRNEKHFERVAGLEVEEY